MAARRGLGSGSGQSLRKPDDVRLAGRRVAVARGIPGCCLTRDSAQLKSAWMIRPTELAAVAMKRTVRERITAIASARARTTRRTGVPDRMREYISWPTNTASMSKKMSAPLSAKKRYPSD